MNGYEMAREIACIEVEQSTNDALNSLMEMLEIDRDQGGWREKLAPFACVWAAMVTAESASINERLKTEQFRTAESAP